MENQIVALLSIRTPKLGDFDLEIHNSMLLSNIDGHVLCHLTNSDFLECPLCLLNALEMNNIENVGTDAFNPKVYEVKDDRNDPTKNIIKSKLSNASLKYGIQPLHG